ncbi:MAG: hypothetical protein KGO82_19020, partial [Bacteroidota bacterium]|nr:hypothetical protein [Bacteroidota bacterium]
RQLFGVADAAFSGLVENEFCYRWVQTFATSTKSYQAYKTGGYTDAAAITCEGIVAAFELQYGRSCAVISLYIAQMFLNLAKIYLVAGQLEAWQATMLQNIHYLLNFEPPPGYGDGNAGPLADVPAALREWLLVECINQVLKFNLTCKGLPHGDELLASIQVKYRNNDFNVTLAEGIAVMKNGADNPGADNKLALRRLSQACSSGHPLAPLLAYIRLQLRGMQRTLTSA